MIMSQDEAKKLEVKMAVLDNKMENIDQNVKDIKKTLEDYIKSEGLRHEKQEETFFNALDAKADKIDVNAIKENLSWVVKLVLGTVILALLGLVITSK